MRSLYWMALAGALALGSVTGPSQATPLLPSAAATVPAAEHADVTLVHWRPYRHRHWRHRYWHPRYYHSRYRSWRHHRHYRHWRFRGHGYGW